MSNDNIRVAKANRDQYRWYLSAKLVRQYCRIAMIPDDDGGPCWIRAEKELGALIDHARATDSTTRGGHTIFRVGRVKICNRSRKARLEFAFSHQRRNEGNLPQLIWVRDKESRRRT